MYTVETFQPFRDDSANCLTHRETCAPLWLALSKWARELFLIGPRGTVSILQDGETILSYRGGDVLLDSAKWPRDSKEIADLQNALNDARDNLHRWETKNEVKLNRLEQKVGL